MNDPIIFLDIDGVLVSGRQMEAVPSEHISTHEYLFRSFDSEAMNALSTIIKLTNAKVVITSTWRSSNSLMKCIRDAFKQYKIPAETIIGQTPNNPFVIRGKEIKQWIEDHNYAGNYVIIDDSSDMLEEQMNNFVNTTTYMGLLADQIQEVINLL